MAKEYKFADRAWNVTHKSGKHLGVATVTADDMRNTMRTLQQEGNWMADNPEGVQEHLQNSVGNILWNHKVDPEDVELTEIKNNPRRGPRKSYD